MIGNNRVIAVCMSKVHDRNRFEHIRLMNECFKAYGYKMFVYQTCSDLYWQTQNEYGERCVFNLIDFQVVDAVIVFCEAIWDQVLIKTICSQAKEHNKPVILVSGNREGCIEISHDYVKGFEKVVRHVIEDHGVRDIHFIAGIKDNIYSEERVDVFRKVAAENGITVDDSMISYGRFWSGPTIQAVEKLIAEKRVPKAFICANDIMAITACDVLHKNGYCIPEDVIVTGFDGIEVVKYANPSLTTCENDVEGIAERITEVLKQLFAGEKCKHEYKLGGKIRHYESCGCNKIDKRLLNAAIRLNQLGDLLGQAQQVDRKMYEIATRAQTCKKVSQLPEILKEMPAQDVCIVLNERALDEKIDPTISYTGSVFDESMRLVYQTGITEEQYAGRITRDEIVLNLESVLEKGNPLIFTPINFLNVALGYVCFYFDVSYENYSMIPQIAIGLNNAIVGFRNLRYQAYMTKMVEKMYQHDGLTGLYNRLAFFREIDSLYEELADKEDNRMTVISVDVNRLKYINDNFGHEEGDVAIVAVARALKDCWPQEKICVRFGGDEMLAVFVHDKDEAVEEKVITDFRRLVTRFNEKVKKPYEVGASIGLCTSDSNDTDFQRLLEVSDQEMYKDKAISKRNIKSS